MGRAKPTKKKKLVARPREVVAVRCVSRACCLCVCVLAVCVCVCVCVRGGAKLN